MARDLSTGSQVTTAVFPVGGLGTRFLPATKAMPKELLPVIDKPIIQYAVEEAVRAGITKLVFVTGRTKRAIEDHFDANPELESELEARGKDAVAAMVREIIPAHVSCIFIRQPRALGLGHAVLCAEPAVGRAPFAVLLADDLIKSEGPGPTADLVAAYRRAAASYLSVMTVPQDEVSRYGIVVPSAEGVAGLVEKPAPDAAPSQLASIGRYVLEPEIFDVLRELAPGVGGEIQLADAIDRLAKQGRVGSVLLNGLRYDCGDKFGYLTATVDFALGRPEFGSRFRALLEDRLEPARAGVQE